MSNESRSAFRLMLDGSEESSNIDRPERLAVGASRGVRAGAQAGRAAS